MTDDSAEENVEMNIKPRQGRLISEYVTVKPEKLVYNISKPTPLFAMGLDSDGYLFPVLIGTRFYGYDKSVIRIVGGVMIPVSEGSTRVFLNWNGNISSCLVNVDSAD